MLVSYSRRAWVAQWVR